jgi:hypothetical protein
MWEEFSTTISEYYAYFHEKEHWHCSEQEPLRLLTNKSAEANHGNASPCHPTAKASHWPLLGKPQAMINSKHTFTRLMATNINAL